MNRIGGMTIPALVLASLPAQTPRPVSGIHPHLAMWNDSGECGVGAVVPWAGRLWAITYPPHEPEGSSDRLYEVTQDLRQIVRAEHRGGTHAGRLVHAESQQLFLGPYVIDADGHVRVIPARDLFGRITGIARHLTEPATKVYVATMEEGVYEVDVRTLAVVELWTDEQRPAGRHAGLPGYHGKGLYSGQGRLVYANNGEHGDRALRDPTTPAGVLAEWAGDDSAWRIVHRHQFTEVTGPGGLLGNAEPARDPIWSIGWDQRSLLLAVLDQGRWHTFRLPKGSHAYDGAHGWNTEWPRIRDIGESDLLMTMHGLLWRFPRQLGAATLRGLRPRSAYLKVVGDFARWQDHVVFGCDDTARSEFLNKRKAKGEIKAPRSHSNLWFVAPAQLDRLGPPLGHGGFWAGEDVAAGTVSEPLWIEGWMHRGLHLWLGGDVGGTIEVQLDAAGDFAFTTLATVDLPAGGYRWLPLPAEALAVRVRAITALRTATAHCELRADDTRGEVAAAAFDGLARHGATDVLGGLVRARGDRSGTLALAATRVDDGKPVASGTYELDGELLLRPTSDPALDADVRARTAIPVGVLDGDAASLRFVDDHGRRWRLPRVRPDDADGPFGPVRVAREVATERDLFAARGTFFELPAENAGGFARLRPVASHDRFIHDFCSFRGLFVATGVAATAPADGHVVRSTDGRAAVWVGAIDDLWRLGKPRGYGGPWLDTPVVAGQPSEPFLATGYDEKELTLQHDAATTVPITLQADLLGDGRWATIERFRVPPKQPLVHTLPRAWSACWVRVVADTACRASAQFHYR